MLIFCTAPARLHRCSMLSCQWKHFWVCMIGFIYQIKSIICTTKSYFAISGWWLACIPILLLLIRTCADENLTSAESFHTKKKKWRQEPGVSGCWSPELQRCEWLCEVSRRWRNELRIHHKEKKLVRTVDFNVVSYQQLMLVSWTHNKNLCQHQQGCFTCMS